MGSCSLRRGVRRHGLLVVLPVVAILHGCGEETVANAPPQVVGFVEAEAKTFERTVSLTGTIVARNTSTYSFETSGRVTDVYVDVGDTVDPGTLLAKIEPTQQQADVAAARAKVDSAEAGLAQAKAAFGRQRQLLAKGFTTRSDYDQADQALASAQSTVDSAKSDLTNAEKTLGNTVLKADAKGVITSRSIDPGQVVGAAQAAFGFAKSGALDAVFKIQEQLLISGQEPNAIEVALVEDPSVTATGHIREVSPLIDSSTGTVQVKLGLENPPEKMGLGSAVVGRETGEAPDKAISLPWTALVESQGKPAVWVLKSGDKATLTNIEVAAYRTDDVLVASGIDEGARVITEGSQLVLPNATLELVPAKNEAN